MVAVKPSVSQYCRTTSCLGEPQEDALTFLLADDLTKLTGLLADVCPVSDEERGKTNEFPLPDNHWINQNYGTEYGCKTLLMLAMEKDQQDFPLTLLSAGAKAEAYNDFLGVAPIHIAAKKGNVGLAKLLLEGVANNKANVDAMNRSGSTALHIASEQGDVQMVEYLLGLNASVDAEDAVGRRTPLYLAAKNKHSEVARILLANGASTLNTSYGKTVEEVLQENMPYFDITKVEVIKKPRRSSYKDFGYGLNNLLDKAQLVKEKDGSNAQNLLQFECLIQRLTKSQLDEFDANGMNLFQKACEYGLEDFVQCLLDNGVDPNATIAQCGSKPVLLAAYHAHYSVLNVLLDHKLKSIDGTKTTDFAAVERTGRESVLHQLLLMPDKNVKVNNYEECLNLLLECDNDRVANELGKIINFKDGRKNTPLHYATALWPQTICRKLLDRGANIGIKNLWEEVPISKIMPQTMEDFLDEHCLTSNGQPVTSEELELTFDYSFLAPPIDDLRFDETDEEGQKMVEREALPETESLWHMGQSKVHRHLLKHPVITSFLYLKWQKIRGYFHRNLRFYFLFVTALTWYIFERYGGMSTRTDFSKNTTKYIYNETTFCSELSNRPPDHTRHYGFWYITFTIHAIVQVILMVRDWRREVWQGCNSFLHCLRFLLITCWMDWAVLGMIVATMYLSSGSLWSVLTILLALLMLREAFQMSVSLKRYLFTPENWLEGFMIVLVAIILWVPDSQFESPCNLKRHLAAIAIVLSWAEMITLVARHPRLSRYNIYVTMFYKVLKTFTFFLIWYSFFVVAFALGFYIMLHKDVPEEDQSGDKSGEEEEEAEQGNPYFNHPWLAMVKTTIMFVGEIEFGDLPIDTNGWLSYLFLLAFVFLIIVVLMNLLNGLAVSDTGLIREKAEIVSHVARVDTISYTESILLGDPFDFLSNWPPMKWISNLPSLALMRCLYKNSVLRHLAHKITGATDILLFYATLPEKSIQSYPNKLSGPCCSTNLSDLPREISEAAMSIIVKKEEANRIIQLSQFAESSAKSLADKVGDLERKINQIMDALRITRQQ